MKTSTVAKSNGFCSTLFQLAPRLEVPALPRISKLAQSIETAKSKRAEGKNITNFRIVPDQRSDARKINGFSNKDYKTELKTADFHLEAPSAESVKLAADFTDWEKYPLDMIKAEDGVWFTIVPLPPGNYSYRFIVDGKWCDDPHSTKRTPNPFGAANSVVEVA